MYVVPADIPTKLFTIKKNIFVVMEGGSVAMSAGAHTTSFFGQFDRPACTNAFSF
jgi:hypothetical protein